MVIQQAAESTFPDLVVGFSVIVFFICFVVGILVGCLISLRMGTVYLFAIVGVSFVGNSATLITEYGFLDERMGTLLFMLTFLWIFRSFMGFTSVYAGVRALSFILFCLFFPMPVFVLLATEFTALWIAFFIIVVGSVILTILLSFFMKEVYAYFTATHIAFFSASVYMFSTVSETGLFTIVVGIALYLLIGFWGRISLQVSSQWTLDDNPYLTHGYMSLSLQGLDRRLFQLAKGNPEKALMLSQFIWDYRPMSQVFAYRLWDAAVAAKWAQGLADLMTYKPEPLSSDLLHTAFFDNRDWTEAYEPTLRWTEQLDRIRECYDSYCKATSLSDKRMYLNSIVKAIEAFDYYNDQQHYHWREFYQASIQSWIAEVEMLKKSLSTK